MKFREWVHRLPQLLSVSRGNSLTSLRLWVSRLANGAEEFSCVGVAPADDLLTDDVMRRDGVATPLTAPRRK